MARPTRFCAKCGEHVEERYVAAPTHYEPRRMVDRLIHIDADGNRIYRGHNAKEEKPDA